MNLEELARQFRKLPGVGPRTAEKMAYAWLTMEHREAEEFISTLEKFRRNIRFCDRCHNLTVNQDLCDICRDPRREKSIVVVESPQDVENIEQAGIYHGYYHVLHGLVSPRRGVTPQDLFIDDLVERITKEGIKEVIIATSFTLEGDLTADYVARRLRGLDVPVYRIGTGLPVGGELNYADKATLRAAFITRQKVGDQSDQEGHNG
ncbi:recombination protein RecR [Coprothermobacteraceae bacterium]|nr:recombination protein RecR [Coprothermobacteraceae bacterium]